MEKFSSNKNRVKERHYMLNDSAARGATMWKGQSSWTLPSHRSPPPAVDAVIESLKVEKSESENMRKKHINKNCEIKISEVCNNFQNQIKTFCIQHLGEWLFINNKNKVITHFSTSPATRTRDTSDNYRERHDEVAVSGSEQVRKAVAQLKFVWESSVKQRIHSRFAQTQKRQRAWFLLELEKLKSQIFLFIFWVVQWVTECFSYLAQLQLVIAQSDAQTNRTHLADDIPCRDPSINLSSVSVIRST